MKNSISHHALLQLSLAAATFAAANMAVGAPTLIPKPEPHHQSSEAGRKVAQQGNLSLMSAYRIGATFGEKGGGAFVFADGNPTPVHAFEIAPSVIIEKANGQPCEILDTSRSLVGSFVAMSDEWVALGTNSLGNGGGPAYFGDCAEAVTTVFLASKVSGTVGTFSDLDRSVAVPMHPSGEQFQSLIRSMAMTDQELVVGTRYGAHVYTRMGTDWQFVTTLDGDADSSNNFGAKVAIDGNRIVVGDPEAAITGKVYLYEKLNGQWQLQAQFGPQASWEIGYGYAVDIDGDKLVVAANSKDANDKPYGIFGYLSALEYKDGALNVIDKSAGFAAHSVAISGNKIIAGGFSTNKGEIDRSTEPTILYKLYPDSLKYEGSITGVNDLHSSSQVWFTDDVDIHGETVIAGWRGYESDAGVGAVGAVIHDEFPNPFQTLPLVDNAEERPVWMSSGEYHFQRHYGSTPSSGTGPTTGSGGSKYYYYVETSAGGANTAGDRAVFESEPFHTANTELFFDYHMYGADVGTLYLDVQVPDHGWLTYLWSRNGQDHSSEHWQSGYYDLSPFSHYDKVKVRFRLVADGGYRGDVALDNIMLLPRN